MKKILTSLTVISFVVAGTVFAKAPKAKTKEVKKEAGVSQYIVAPAKSTVQWTGSKLVGGSHTGKVKVKSGDVAVTDGKVTKGVVLVDMTSIVNEDLTDAAYNKKLVDHLKSPDFFDIEKHPTAQLTIDKDELVKPGEHKMEGTLSIKDKTKPITFTAVEKTDKGNKVVSTELTFDRTDFDVRYGSGKFFQNLGDKVITDEVKLKVDLVLDSTPVKSAKK